MIIPCDKCITLSMCLLKRNKVENSTHTIYLKPYDQVPLEKDIGISVFPRNHREFIFRLCEKCSIIKNYIYKDIQPKGRYDYNKFHMDNIIYFYKILVNDKTDYVYIYVVKDNEILYTEDNKKWSYHAINA